MERSQEYCQEQRRSLEFELSLQKKKRHYKNGKRLLCFPPALKQITEVLKIVWKSVLKESSY